jgi:hypothetical protein
MEKKLIVGHAELMYVFFEDKLKIFRDVNSKEEAERADILLNLWEEVYKTDNGIEQIRWTTYECRNPTLCWVAELVDWAWREGAIWREIKRMLELIQL